jgi:hypothetical protein
MSALPPKADIGGRELNVRFVPIADIAAIIRSRARESSVDGIVRPRFGSLALSFLPIRIDCIAQ